MRREGTTSFGALVLAFLTSLHHNLHMALLTFGRGGIRDDIHAGVPERSSGDDSVVTRGCRENTLAR